VSAKVTEAGFVVVGNDGEGGRTKDGTPSDGTGACEREEVAEVEKEGTSCENTRAPELLSIVMPPRRSTAVVDMEEAGMALRDRSLVVSVVGSA